MSALLAVARKELRAWFLSPVALLFIATFLLSALFGFFWVEGFFARNLADARPLFTWLPPLLAFLVPALGMRLWSEEERTGTFELLQTLPIRTPDLVVGKFVAGLGLVGVALALTAPVPVTVALLGDLDWGPVFGGYVATMLLAAAYLAITLCVSATTANQLVALGVSVLVCGGLYLVGSDAVTAVFGHRVGELLRAVGAGGRFDSVLRGVLDLRDLAWFVSLSAFFLVLNTWLVDRRRWSGSARGEDRRRNRAIALGLLATNLVALNVWLEPVRALRVDLTEWREYSISPVTKELLGGLDEPLLIRGYFSAKTHPLLAPLVPRVRDLIEEYGAVGGDRVRAEFVDPTSDPELEKEAAQSYGVEPVPFQFEDRYAASVVNSYFHVVVQVGDQTEVLDFEDLIEVEVVGMDVDVRLRNLEYDLTRAIQKVVYGFQSIESVVARLPAAAHLTAYVGGALPEGFEELPARIETVVKQVADRSGGRLTWEQIDPTKQGASIGPEALYQRFGIQPFAASLFSDQTFYLHLVLRVGDRLERLALPGSLTEADIKDELVASLKRAAGGGALKTVGLALPDGPPPQMPGMPPMGGGGGLPFDGLRGALEAGYAVESVDLKSGRVGGDVDVLLVLDPRDLDDASVFAVDQFLMRGGAVVVASGAWAMSPNPMSGLSVSKVRSGLEDWLKGYGIEIGGSVVLDPQSSAFPIPVTRNLGGFSVREVQMLPYPAFPDIRDAGLVRDQPALAGLPGVVLHWPSPITLSDGEGLPVRTPLLKSSADAWTLDDYDAQPDFQLHPDLGWPGGEAGERVLAATAKGPFDSAWKGKSMPEIEGGASLLEQSPAEARLAVIASANFVADPILELSRATGESGQLSLALVQNLVDWGLEDEGLLAIRARARSARTLRPVPVATRGMLEWGNYGFAILAVAGIGLMTLRRRRDAEPYPLLPPSDGAAGSLEIRA